MTGHSSIRLAVAVAVAVSLMFVRDAASCSRSSARQAFGRLVHGLVSRSALLTEKVGERVVRLAVTLVMLFGLAAFVGLDWSRVPAG